MASKSDEIDNSKTTTSAERRVNAFKAHQFKKGASGNPGGRPAGLLTYEQTVARALKSLADEKGISVEELQVVLMKNDLIQASKGQFNFSKDYKDRLFGQATQKIQAEVSNKSLADIVEELEHE